MTFHLRHFCLNSESSALTAPALLLVGLLGLVPAYALASSNCGAAPSASVATNGMTFPAYDPLGPSLTSSTGVITVSATCGFTFSPPFTLNYSIALSAGSSNSFTPRTLMSGVNKLQYNLYTSVAYASIWGDGTGGSQMLADQIIGTCTTFGFINCSGSKNDIVYGNIPAMQDVSPGSYDDNITITVTF